MLTLPCRGPDDISSPRATRSQFSGARSIYYSLSILKPNRCDFVCETTSINQLSVSARPRRRPAIYICSRETNTKNVRNFAPHRSPINTFWCAEDDVYLFSQNNQSRHVLLYSVCCRSTVETRLRRRNYKGFLKIKRDAQQEGGEINV